MSKQKNWRRAPAPGTHVFRVLARPPFRSKHKTHMLELEVIDSPAYIPGELVLWPISAFGMPHDMLDNLEPGNTVICEAIRKPTRYGQRFLWARWPRAQREFVPAQTPTPTAPTELPCTCSAQQFELGTLTLRDFSPTCPYHTEWTRKRSTR